MTGPMGDQEHVTKGRAEHVAQEHVEARTEEQIVHATVEGNEAVARIAHAVSEVIAIYPITPSSGMGELADQWSAQGRTNLWGQVPEVIEMQSEGGAAGALHGALTKGSLATTFTASQGLLLMIPNMFKIAGELTPAVIHVAARAVATHALSIFGDHSDVMAVRQTGWAMLCSGGVQEAQDLAAVAHAATLRSRVPFVHFFDGFRTSHEITTIDLLPYDAVRSLVREEDLAAHRARGLSPDHPTIRGTAENPDTFFQAAEAANPFHDAVPATVQQVFDEFAALTGRAYHLVEYTGAPDADRVVVVMGSAAGTLAETAAELNARGEKVGVVTVRLYRPFPVDAFLAALPPTVRGIAVLDRTKEAGAPAEPLLADVLTALAEGLPSADRSHPRVIGGRYGLSSKEFDPRMAKAVFDELAAPAPKRRFTVGITDDVTHLSLTVDPTFELPAVGRAAVFYGLGSDGTVGASKNTVKILGELPGRWAQGYFVYDSRKSGATTVSHLRFSREPIRSSYLVQEANFVGVHQFGLLSAMRTLDIARTGATVLLNSPYGPDGTWDRLPVEVQQLIVDRGLTPYVVDAEAVAREVGMGKRINTIMQTCYFYLSGVLEPEEAIAAIKASVEKTYAKRGRTVIERNHQAIDAAVEHLAPLPVGAVTSTEHRQRPVPAQAPDFVKRVTQAMLHGRGDELPVSALPVDGTWPTATSQWEKRAIASEIPIWDPSICIDCGKCAITCPHAAIRVKVMPEAALEGAPATLQSKPYKDRTLKDHRLIVQVAPDDCTGCGICVDICPARSKTEVKHKSINLEPAREHREVERANFEFFLGIPEIDRALVRHDQVKGAAQLQPLFEFSLACSGCGETPYIRTLTQLFGDRMIIANATGCSSIYGANMPTVPYAQDPRGRGPAWSNSLFEDNAEFGLGMRLAWEQQHAEARRLVALRRDLLGDELTDGLLEADQSSETGIAEQRTRVTRLRGLLAAHQDDPVARRLALLADELVEKTVWIIGGDGWAYDIGSGGLDHVLASGRNVNILVLDTEVYSNTGGQASKATPRAAAAKFAASGKARPKKDLGLLAQAYGNVYVAQLAIGANQQQTIRAMLEAQAWDGPSLLIAYSTCIAHGIDMETSMTHQADAVASAYWPLYRFRPDTAGEGHPLHLDSKAPTKPVTDFMRGETRFTMLTRSDPQRAAELAALAQSDADERWRYYSQLAGMERTVVNGAHPDDETGDRTTHDARTTHDEGSDR
ncbi:pyruvate:ferredoxin (flavodoxin) oxidoreductase [Raineyella sp. W15-4]|uniref:pyruvate:ferredoxin (flavodoxin) oxidoreductase n=1 Tax=Raineyella sp. W15-4 TaxID=3081651 RepID=UPI002953D376|nr:pyruvate:ferredoxin (flavodoxin) oxidoreductase [Raineyella sp. W15-4]WOQ16941.1 pyruvate:ferredoxin (flavodoxin) oxidoreductase [Raineyella sp. W15-4]